MIVSLTALMLHIVTGGEGTVNLICGLISDPFPEERFANISYYILLYAAARSDEDYPLHFPFSR